MAKLPVILVHGAWHDSRCWEAVAALLRDKGFAVHAPDLPGHGGNQKLPLHRVTLASYVECLTTLLAEISTPCVLVAHSMAGVPVTQVAAQNPALVAGIVYISAYLPSPGESLFDLMALNRAETGAVPVEAALQMSDDKRSCTIGASSSISLFYNRCSPEVAATATAGLNCQATLPMSAKLQYDPAVLSTVPDLYICCTDDNVLPLQHQYRMLQRRGCRALLRIEADHSPFLSCPEELTDMLQAAVDNFT